MPGLLTWRALPTGALSHLDPFLFLNHHGPEEFPPHNDGLPFGPHPHRGFETLTFIIDGDVMHADNTGVQSVIKAGGVQWMTAGRGIIHTEVSSPSFMECGGRSEILQLWMNLPARLKMTPPAYHGLQAADLPTAMELDGKVQVQVISGNWKGVQGAHESITGLSMYRLDWSAAGTVSLDVPEAEEIFCYVVRGGGTLNGSTFGMRQLVRFGHLGHRLEIEAEAGTIVLLGSGVPYKEPIAAHGPFVMNTYDEIRQAIADYQNGGFGPEM